MKIMATISNYKKKLFGCFTPGVRWDPKFDHESNAQPLFEILNLVRWGVKITTKKEN